MVMDVKIKRGCAGDVQEWCYIYTGSFRFSVSHLSRCYNPLWESEKV
jgi:hypothetical protein